LALGNLEAIRDWGYAPDYVQAMWKMLQADTPADYVIATGVGHTIREFCEAAFSKLDLDYRDYVVFDQNLYRPVESVPLIGNAKKIRQELGWQPQVGFQQLVSIMIDSDMANL